MAATTVKSFQIVKENGKDILYAVISTRTKYIVGEVIPYVKPKTPPKEIPAPVPIPKEPEQKPEDPCAFTLKVN